MNTIGPPRISGAAKGRTSEAPGVATGRGNHTQVPDIPTSAVCPVADPHTEYAQLYSDGSMAVRPSNIPDLERIYPLQQWIYHNTRNGGRVFRRTIIVVEDWQEVL